MVGSPDLLIAHLGLPIEFSAGNYVQYACGLGMKMIKGNKHKIFINAKIC